MSTIFTLTGIDDTLSADFNPPIFLDEGSEYVLGLLNFETYNSIHNVTEDNNEFTIRDAPTAKSRKLSDGSYDGTSKTIKLPEGAYEINNINEYIQTALDPNNHEYVQLQASNSTLKTLIKCTKELDFTSESSIGRMLGFESGKYPANTWHTSQNHTKIMKINALLIYCNLSLGSYKNGRPSHIIHQFFPTVPPGYKIVECPSPVIYLPISARTINNITVQILDQDENPISFNNESITVTLHLKKL